MRALRFAAMLFFASLLCSQTPHVHKPSCGKVLKRLHKRGPELQILDLGADLVGEAGLTRNPELLARGGTPVKGVAGDGATIVLIRFRANFVGERIEVTLQDNIGKPSASSSPGQDGALAGISDIGDHVPLGRDSLHFDSGPLTVTALKNRHGAIAFALYRAPEFIRDELDEGRTTRSVSIQLRSLDLPCFYVTGAVAQ